MGSNAFIDRIRRYLRDLRAANGANVTVTFALATIPMVGFVGAAVDYSHANSVKAAMQAAADSTALMLSKTASTLNNSQLQTKALDYFKALFNRPEATGLTVTAAYTTTDGNKIKVDATSNVKTTFMNIMGFSTMKVGVDSQVAWGNARLRVALALDNTPSMDQSGKIDALKSATKGLIEQLQSVASTNGDVYVSIVPFSTDVNVGAGNVNAPWIDWTEWDAANGTCVGGTGSDKSNCETASCSISSKTSKSSCTSAGTCSISGNSNKNDCESDGVCSKSQNSTESKCKNNGGKWTSGVWTPGVWSQGTWQVDHSKWTGCIQDRDKSPVAYNATNTTPTGTKALFPADPSDNKSKAYCPVPVMPQTYDWAALQKKVKDMDTIGYTNTTIGLVHGWQTLTDGAPYFPPPIKTGDNIPTQKIIIFLTDGENTRDRWDNKNTNIDARMKAACDNAKAGGITVFTVLVMEGNDSLLKSCASPDDAAPKGPKYFKLTSAGQLVATFNQIGTALSNLRIAK